MKHSASYQVAIANSGLTVKVDDGDTLLSGILRAGVGVPYECNAGGCGSCKYTLLEGEVADDLEESAGLRASDKRKHKHLACISRPRSDCKIDLKLDAEYTPQNPPQKTEAVLHSVEKLTHDLWEFRFDSTGPAYFLPGQYAKLSLPGVDGPRSYSMSNIANEEGRWAFQIKRVKGGEASEVLFGDSLYEQAVTIDAPYSIAHLQPHSDRPVICIAGGSGLAPMVSILRGIAQRDDTAANPILYYGARTGMDLVTKTYFETIPGFCPDDQYVPIVSEPDKSESWSGAKGLVHDFLKENLKDHCNENEYYLAGPPPMVDAVRRLLVLDRGVPVERLHYDRFF